MNCGVKFCGGCNPRYDRGEAFKTIKNHFEGRIDFFYAEEGKEYDLLLVIGGCTNCCASLNEYGYRLACIRMRDKDQLDSIIEMLENQYGTQGG